MKTLALGIALLLVLLFGTAIRTVMQEVRTQPIDRRAYHSELPCANS